MVMHHPLNWLRDWSQHELKTLLRDNFALVLSGHVHDQDLFHSIQHEGALVECSAPPLFTNKTASLGYAIISVCEHGVTQVIYRQWTGKSSFVRGVNFSNNDDGVVLIREKSNQAANGQEGKAQTNSDKNSYMLQKRLEDALQTFSTQPKLWIDPVISTKPYSSFQSSLPVEDAVQLDTILESADNYTFVAPPQFGLTCLSFFLSKEAWAKRKKIWTYLDFKEVKLHNIEKFVSTELASFGLGKTDLECIIIDGYSLKEKDAVKYLNKIKSLYPGVRIILMQAIEESGFGEAVGEHIIEDFITLYLLPLPRNEIRKVISKYNSLQPIGDEDTILKKVVSDLEVLNIHRTPLNCLTLLKALENNFDDNPVNRSELIHSILFLLFEVDKIPSYKSRPDLKDCEFVLGRLCEEMIRQTYAPIFSRDSFIKKLETYCRERVIDLEVSLVFDILYNNNIIVRRENGFTFRFTYWIYYFAAVGMRHNPDFADYIFAEMRYASYPEIVEFYTGLDRGRKDALQILTVDLRKINEAVEHKVGLPDNMNPYRNVNWNPSPQSVNKMNAEIGEGVHNSKLPEDVKDQFQDSGYDPKKPFNQQSIRAIFEEYSLSLLWESTKAASRALRNSDYVDPVVKRELLHEITKSWKQISKVVLALSPLIADRGTATFDGTGFVLLDCREKEFVEKWKAIILNVSYNIVRWFQNDIASQRIGALLHEYLKHESDELKRHQVALLILSERPKNWKVAINEYIEILHKNSYYLYDLYTFLQQQYDYGFLTNAEVHDIRSLLKATLSKHNFGSTAKSNRIPDSTIERGTK